MRPPLNYLRHDQPRDVAVNFRMPFKFLVWCFRTEKIVFFIRWAAQPACAILADMAESSKHSFLGNLLMGLFFVAMGVIPILASFDIGIASTRDLHGPRWLGLVAGGVFVLAGFAVWAGEKAKFFRNLMGVLIFICLAAIGNWIAFGVGERICTGGFGDTQPGEGFAMGGLACRIPFGIGAVIMDAVLIYGFVWALQKLAGGPPRLALLMKWAEWLVLLVLSPLLLVLFLPVIFKTVVTRLRTGEWPRNEAFIRRQREKGLLRDKDDG